MFHPRSWILCLLVVGAAALRVVDHPWNFAPVGALALFCGAYFRDRKWAFIVPLAAMFLGDVAIGLIRHNPAFYTFHWLAPVIYGCYAFIVILGFGVRAWWRRTGVTEDGGAEFQRGSTAESDLPARVVNGVLPVVAGTLAGAVVFFLVTNFAVWALFEMYPKTWAGLTTCYVKALPFFRTTLAGDAFYASLLFGGFVVLQTFAALTWDANAVGVKR